MTLYIESLSVCVDVLCTIHPSTSSMIFMITNLYDSENYKDNDMYNLYYLTTSKSLARKHKTEISLMSD